MNGFKNKPTEQPMSTMLPFFFNKLLLFKKMYNFLPLSSWSKIKLLDGLVVLKIFSL